MKQDRPTRFSAKQLEKWFNKFGWFVAFDENKDFPYNTVSCYLVPSDNEHLPSNEMIELCYAFGYYDAKVDYKNKVIVLW